MQLFVFRSSFYNVCARFDCPRRAQAISWNVGEAVFLHTSNSHLSIHSLACGSSRDPQMQACTVRHIHCPYIIYLYNRSDIVRRATQMISEVWHRRLITGFLLRVRGGHDYNEWEFQKPTSERAQISTTILKHGKRLGRVHLPRAKVTYCGFIEENFHSKHRETHIKLGRFWYRYSHGLKNSGL